MVMILMVFTAGNMAMKADRILILTTEVGDQGEDGASDQKVDQ
jgi:hypothetical protein